MMSRIFWVFFSCYFPNVNKNNNIAECHSFTISSTLPQQIFIFISFTFLYLYIRMCLFEPHLFLTPRALLNLRELLPVPFCPSWAPPTSSSTVHLRLCLPPCCHTCCLISSHLGGFTSFLFQVPDSSTSLFCSVILYIVVALFLLRTMFLLSHNFLLPVISESNIQDALSIYLILLSQFLTKEKNA